MPTINDTLAGLYSKMLEKQGEEWRRRCAAIHQQRRRALLQLKKKGIVTIADLLAGFSGISSKLKLSTMDLISILQIHQAAPVLIDSLPDRAVRLMAAHALSRLRTGGKATRVFLDIGRRELAASRPDWDWLEAVILGLGASDDPRAADLLVSIFERCDLPGWLRGNAGDKLGINGFIRDRRTSLYRRCRDAALRGLSDDSIDVQFWSMYVIASFCNFRGSRQRSVDKAFRSCASQVARNGGKRPPPAARLLVAHVGRSGGCHRLH